MKLHLPITLLNALLGAFIAQAVEIPDGYEQIDLWTPSYLDDYTSNASTDSYAFWLYTDLSFTPTTSTKWSSAAPLVKGGNLIFTSADGYAPLALSFSDGKSTVFEQPSNLTFDTLSNLVFANQVGSGNGGAIDLSTNGNLNICKVIGGESDFADVIFADNKISSNYGGAIYANGTNTKINISDNGDVAFYRNSGNSASYGGAIYSTGSINLSDNKKVDFTDNTAANGGAICSSGNLFLNKNYSVAFSQNYGVGSQGGAIYSSGNISIVENLSDVIFSGNYVKNDLTTGGAIYSSGSIDISSNKGVVSFIGNNSYSTYYSSQGGAIYSSDDITVSNNAEVIFSKNFTYASKADSGYSYGWATPQYYYYFYSYGGAIYSTGSLVIEGNDCVVFEKNYESYAGSVRLRSLYMSPNSSNDKLSLAAKSGGHITFYDSLYMGNYSGATVSFNADYEDEDGVTQKAGGDIIFSGKYTAAHLAEVKGAAATTDKIRESQTSEINNLITLYGGSLQVVDGAKLNGRGLTVADGSGAKLLLRNGSMSHSGYNFTFNSGTTLELQGLNTITASKLSMGSGSTLSVTIGTENLSNAALALGDTDLFTSQLTVNLNRTDGLTSGMYKIISQNSASDFTTKSAWTAENVTVNGSGYADRASFSDLVWENGTLYYKVGRTIWGNGSGDYLWNTTSDNWTMNDRSYTYLDGMDVTFTDLGAGDVKLVGDVAPSDIIVDNSEGNDYTFSAAQGGGKLAGNTAITKNGTGALTLTTSNEYTGATVLNAGTLNVHHSTALGATATSATATVTTKAGTLLAIDNCSHVVLAGKNNIAGNVSVAAGSMLELQNTGYAAAANTVNGILAFTGSASATSTVGSLTGTGTVVVTDSNVSFASQSKFTGNLTVHGDNASLSIASGNYSGSGKLEANGNGATINLGGNNVTLKSGGQIKLGSDSSGDNTSAAKLTANNVTIAKGATITVEGSRVIETDGTIQTITLAEYDPMVAMNARAVGIADVAKLTISSGATYEALYGNMSMNGGELTLAVPSALADKIQLVLHVNGIIGEDTQVVLFTDAAKANFIYDGSTSTFSANDSTVYTLNAADYFTGEAINENTKLVYDSGTIYLTGANNVVPEPATATLSLLALAALAVRRRRK